MKNFEGLSWNELYETGYFIGPNLYLLGDFTALFETKIAAVHQRLLLPKDQVTIYDIGAGVRTPIYLLLTTIKKLNFDCHINITLVDPAYGIQETLSGEAIKAKAAILILQSLVPVFSSTESHLDRIYWEAKDYYTYGRYNKFWECINQLFDYFKINIHFECARAQELGQIDNSDLTVISSLINYIDKTELELFLENVLVSSRNMAFINDQDKTGRVGHLVNPNRAANYQVLQKFYRHGFVTIEDLSQGNITASILHNFGYSSIRN